MPLPAPPIDDRTISTLVDETARAGPGPHSGMDQLQPGDPGVTLVQLFAFLTENLLYRANQIPERNRAKFLQLLASRSVRRARREGLVAIRNERGPLEPPAIAADLELRAGAMPFRTQPASTCCRSRRAVSVKRPVRRSDAGAARLLRAALRLLRRRFPARR